MVVSGLVDRVDVSHYRLSVHLVVAFIILSLIFWNYLKLNSIRISKYQVNQSIAFLFVLLIFLQIIIGAFVSGMDAGKIYNSWPLMGETYFPNDNSIENLFKLSAFNDASLVQFIHRNLAYLICFVYLYLFFIVYKKKLNSYITFKNSRYFYFTSDNIGNYYNFIWCTDLYCFYAPNKLYFLVSSSIYFFYKNSRSN